MEIRCHDCNRTIGLRGGAAYMYTKGDSKLTLCEYDLQKRDPDYYRSVKGADAELREFKRRQKSATHARHDISYLDNRRKK